MKIIVNPPDPDTPGFNERALFSLEIKEAQEHGTMGMTASLYRRLIEFLAQFVTVEREDGEPVLSNYDALLKHATERQMMALMEAIAGGGANAQVPPASGGPSATM